MRPAACLAPVHTSLSHRSSSDWCGMPLGFQCLLSLAVSKVGIHMYRVSHVKEKITKLFSGGLHESSAQLLSATVMCCSGSQAFPTLFPCFSRISLSPMRYSKVWNEKQERLHAGTLLHGKYQALAEMVHGYSACVWCIAHMDTLPGKKKG